jgi:uncharacterized membrane protein
MALMKNIFGFVAKFIGIILFLLFLFLAFVAFNPKSASFIVNSSANSGFFYEKSVRVFSGLLILLAYQSCSSFFLLFFEHRLQAEKRSLLPKVFAIAGLLICVSIYFYSAIFPWSIPTTR